MSEVFVSYKRENLAAVGRLVEGLRADGIGVWWDQDIAPNAAWEATIEQQLAVAKLVIVAWSPAAVASENVKAEARWARQQGRLLQVFVEACEPPLFFGERQGIDLKHWSGAASEAAFRSVLEAVRAGLVAAPAAAQARTEPPPLHAEAPPALPTKPSIAVMSFANLSGDPEQEYFADGMVEEIITALSRVKSIFVIGGGSSLALKGHALTPQDAAARLGVRYILEGSIRNAGGRVRIAVKLTDAADGAQIWAERFEDTLDDVFALQDRVALAVAGKIEPTVLRMEMHRAARRPTESMGSYDLYLRAWTLIQGNATPNCRAALALLDRALELDPNYAHALGLSAISYGLICLDTAASQSATEREQCIDLAHRALRAADGDALVVTFAAGALCMAGGDLDMPLSLIERAIGLNPGLCLAWHWSGVIRAVRGDADQGAEDTQTSMRLDPLSLLQGDQLFTLGFARLQQRRFDEAASLLIQSTQLLPAWAFGHYSLASCLGQLGQVVPAREALARARSLTNRPLEEVASAWLRTPQSERLLLEGIALAERDP